MIQHELRILYTSQDGKFCQHSAPVHKGIHRSRVAGAEAGFDMADILHGSAVAQSNNNSCGFRLCRVFIRSDPSSVVIWPTRRLRRCKKLHMTRDRCASGNVDLLDSRYAIIGFSTFAFPTRQSRGAIARTEPLAGSMLAPPGRPCSAKLNMLFAAFGLHVEACSHTLRLFRAAPGLHWALYFCIPSGTVAFKTIGLELG